MDDGPPRLAHLSPTALPHRSPTSPPPN